MSDDKREPKLVDVARQRPITVEDVPWLVKDFDVLYLVAEATLNVESFADTRAKRAALRALIDHLKPAFEQVQVLKAAIRGRN